MIRTGIFGGSFDPIHNGHLLLAEQCREQAGLDEVWFVPSKTSPFKPEGPVANDRQRTEMIDFAIAGNDCFRVSQVEIERGGKSFTVETLRELTEQHPGREWFLMIGTDSLEGFGKWKEPREICELAIPLVVARPGSRPVDLDSFSQWVDDSRLKTIREHAIESRLIDISSTDIRDRIGYGKSIRFLTPRAVEAFIGTKSIYAKAPDGKGTCDA